MKKFLLAVAMLLLLSGKQIFACDYYEEQSVLEEILNTGAYKSNATGKVCSNDKKSVIRIKNGKVDGKVKVFLVTNFFFIDYIVVEIKFKNGIKEGLEKWYYPSGALWHKVNYKNDKREGLYKKYYESGALSLEINYENGKAEGLAKAYYPSGALEREVNYKNGKREGVEKWYYESGALHIERPYKNNKEEGLEKIYYESGGLMREGNYENGKAEGLTKRYYESGVLSEEENYKNGLNEGLTTKYSEDGKVFVRLFYIKHKLVSGECANGRKLTDVELSKFSYWEKDSKVNCD